MSPALMLVDFECSDQEEMLFAMLHEDEDYGCAGLKGGSVQNPVHALAQFVADLHAPNGSVAVDGFYE
jgi:hypothetical protein